MNRILVSKPVTSTFAWLTVAAMITLSLVGIGAYDAAAYTVAPTEVSSFSVDNAVTFQKEGDFDSAGNYYFPDQPNDMVYKYDASGNLVTSWSSLGTCVPGSFGGQPSSIAVDNADNIWVLNNLCHDVQKFDSSGNHLMAIGGPVFTPTADGFNDPSTIKYDAATNRMYVLDTTWNRIMVLDLAGNFVDTIFLTPAMTSNVNTELGMVVDSAAQRFYIGDLLGKAIWVYDFTGTKLYDWSTSNFPIGLAMDADGDLHVSVSNFSSASNINVYDQTGTLKYTYASLPGIAWGNVFDDSGRSWVPSSGGSGDGMVHIYDWLPMLDQCTIDALAAMGLNPGDFPNLESSLDDACEAAPDDVTVIESGNEPSQNLKLNPGEIVVLGEGANISNNIIGDNGSNNAVYMGSNVTIGGNSLKSDVIWVGGTGNLIEGNVNHEIDVNIGPNAYLRVNGHINDLQNLNIGENGTLDVGGNVDIWVSADIASGALLTVDGNLDCNGAPIVNNDGTVTAGSNNCTLLAALDGGNGGMGGLATYLPLLALAALGMAVYVRPKGK